MLLKFIVLCFLAQGIQAQAGVTFRLYTRTNADTYVPLVTGQLHDLTINVSKPLKIIVHGYTNSADSDWVRNMKDAYLLKGDYNVITVDWKSLAAQIYSNSARDTRVVGKYIADFVIDMNKVLGLSLKIVQCIGHSLGSHVCAFAGKNIISSGNEKIARITGLDPAGPSFNGNPSDQRLSVGDADFIDCIHTDMCKLGYCTSLGDADFYPNGGNAPQPGCFILKRDLRPIACSHVKSIAYFTESINSYEFTSKKCSNYWSYRIGQCNNNPSAVMGENCNPNIRGFFYLTTNAQSPFAQG